MEIFKENIVRIPKNMKFSRVIKSELNAVDFDFGFLKRNKNNAIAKKNTTNPIR